MCPLSFIRLPFYTDVNEPHQSPSSCSDYHSCTINLLLIINPSISTVYLLNDLHFLFKTEVSHLFQETINQHDQ